MQSKPIRLGTRGSPLALAQANEVRDRLLAAWGAGAPEVEIVTISTAGDRIQDRPLSEVGGKGLFTEEIEAGLTSGALDIAVHSSKDLPTLPLIASQLLAMTAREETTLTDIANLVSGSLKKAMRDAEAGLVAPEKMESLVETYFRQIVSAMKAADQLIEDCA